MVSVPGCILPFTFVLLVVTYVSVKFCLPYKYHPFFDTIFSPNDQEPSWASSSVPQVQATRAKRRKVNHSNCSKTGTKGEWHSLDIDDQEPQQFMFCPKRNPGVQLDHHHEYSPLKVFQLFFTKAVLDILCQNTNKYAKLRYSQGSKQTWQGVDPDGLSEPHHLYGFG